jgi:hypothetical protein
MALPAERITAARISQMMDLADEVGDGVDHPGKLEQGIHESPVAAAGGRA